MKNLQTRIENAIPKDKLMHFCVGLLLAQTAYLCAWLICLPVVAGLLKELYDKFIRKTEFDWWDWVVTVLGVVPVGLILFIIHTMS